MKVLQINSVCGFGSTGRIATDLYKVLEEQGHECVIAYGRGSVLDGIKSMRIGTDFDVKVHGVLSRISDKHGFYSKRATQKIIEQIKGYNPDVIHLHNIHGYYINIELLFNYLKNVDKPIIWTLHDCWVFTGHCAHFEFIGCDKWKTGCKKCPQIGSYPSSLIMDNSKWNYQKKKELFATVKNMTIVTPSNWLAVLVEQSFMSKFPIKVINNGIDLDVFKPTPSDFRQRYGIEDKFIILGVASVWDRRKGLDDFIELSRMFDEQYQIVLVGLNKKQLKQMPNNIIGIARTNSVKELAEIYSASDVFVNPSYEDNFPTTNLEALACGKAVITYDTGGSPESIGEGMGVVVSKLDINELARKISDTKNNSIIMEKRTQIELLYDKQKRFMDYFKLYQTMNN